MFNGFLPGLNFLMTCFSLGVEILRCGMRSMRRRGRPILSTSVFVSSMSIQFRRILGRFVWIEITFNFTSSGDQVRNVWKIQLGKMRIDVIYNQQ